MFIKAFSRKIISLFSLALLCSTVVLHTVHAADWTADPTNIYRTNIRSEYITRVDAVVLRILNK